MAVSTVWTARFLHPFCLEQLIKGKIYSKVTFFKLRGLRDGRFQSVTCRGWEKDVWEGSALTRWLCFTVFGSPWKKWGRDQGSKFLPEQSFSQRELFTSLLNLTRLKVYPVNKLPCTLLFIFPSMLLLSWTLYSTNGGPLSFLKCTSPCLIFYSSELKKKSIFCVWLQGTCLLEVAEPFSIWLIDICVPLMTFRTI